MYRQYFFSFSVGLHISVKVTFIQVSEMLRLYCETREMHKSKKVTVSEFSCVNEGFH